MVKSQEVHIFDHAEFNFAGTFFIFKIHHLKSHQNSCFLLKPVSTKHSQNKFGTFFGRLKWNWLEFLRAFTPPARRSAGPPLSELSSPARCWPSPRWRRVAPSAMERKGWIFWTIFFWRCFQIFPISFELF